MAVRAAIRARKAGVLEQAVMDLAFGDAETKAALVHAGAHTAIGEATREATRHAIRADREGRTDWEIRVDMKALVAACRALADGGAETKVTLVQAGALTALGEATREAVPGGKGKAINADALEQAAPLSGTSRPAPAPRLGWQAGTRVATLLACFLAAPWRLSRAGATATLLLLGGVLGGAVLVGGRRKSLPKHRR
jgi:hypothetical protein